MDQIQSFLSFVGLADTHTNRVTAAYFVYVKQGLNDAVNEYYAKPNTVQAIRTNVSRYTKYYDYFDQQRPTGGFNMNSAEARRACQVFDTYKDPELDAFGRQIIGIEGTFALLEAMHLEPEDVAALVFAYYVNAKELGVFEKEDFVSGWCSVGVPDVASMGEFVSRKRTEMYSNHDLFTKVYKFIFGYVLDKQDKANIQKQLPLDEAIDYWKLLLPNVNTEAFFEWLRNESGRKVIKRDEWNMVPPFLELASSGIQHLLENYSEDDAWPLLMDEYVEYLSM